MSNFTHYREHVGSRADKHYKTTLFSGDQLMVGLNCLEPGQAQAVHDHADQDKVYQVLEGEGVFSVDEVERCAGVGSVVWARAGMAHGVRNEGAERLTLLVCIAPPH
ncbi:MAG: cupin domain-containing protein [Anaerolineaceae bacterium]|nr:cupin domain-containing protein [Anaerolineaceae bacterium]